MCDIVQKGLNITSKWCESAGLQLNAKKTAIMVFTKRKKLHGWKPIMYNGEEVEVKTEFKYLGVTLDNKLLWDKHVENICLNAKKAMMVCRRMAGRSWGCSPKILHWMYTMIVRPRLTYGAIAWADRTDLVTARRELDKVQRLACLTITGSMRKCPTRGMEVILGLPPLHLVIKEAELNVRTLARFCRQGFGPNAIIGTKYRDQICRHLPVLAMPMDETINKYEFNKMFDTKLSSKSECAPITR